MKNAAIKTMPAGHVFLMFFNSKEVYDRKMFDTKRQASNYAKKYGYNVVDSLPANIDKYANID